MADVGALIRCGPAVAAGSGAAGAEDRLRAAGSAAAAVDSEAVALPGIGDLMPVRNRLARLWRHVWCDRATVRHRFPASVLAEVGQRIAAGELRHGAEVRVAIEASLGLPAVWARATPRHRALEVFGALRVWDTEHNNGVLIYVLLADHAVEIVADRSAARAIADAEWRAITDAMTDAFRAGRYRDGLFAALDRLEAVLTGAFPAVNHNPDELPNRPALL